MDYTQRIFEFYQFRNLYSETDIIDLVDSGLYPLEEENGKVLKCTFCDFLIDITCNIQENILRKHMINTPRCPILISCKKATTNDRVTHILSEINYYEPIVNLKPKLPRHPKMIKHDLRMKTFIQWNDKWPAIQLVEHGFFFQYPTLICFKCGCKVEEGKNPWKIHKTHPLSYDCNHITPKHKYPNYKQHYLRVKSFMNEPMSMVTPIELAYFGFFNHPKHGITCYSCGFTQTYGSLLTNPELEHTKLTNCFHICTKWYIFMDTKIMEDIKSKNKKLVQNIKDSNICKVCLNEEKQCLFMPCFHCACCKKCAYELNWCPVCRKKITAKINVYMS